MIKAMMQMKLVKWHWSCCSTKIFKQFLENFRNDINKLWNRTDFNLVQKFVVAVITVRDAGDNNDPPAIVAPARLELEIKDTNL